MWPPGSEAWLDAAGQLAGVSLEPCWRLPSSHLHACFPLLSKLSMGLAPAKGPGYHALPLATWWPLWLMLAIVPAPAPVTQAADKSHLSFHLCF